MYLKIIKLIDNSKVCCYFYYSVGDVQVDLRIYVNLIFSYGSLSGISVDLPDALNFDFDKINLFEEIKKFYKIAC